MAIHKKLDILFKRFLEKRNKTILEIGCAKAKRLIYFAKEKRLLETHNLDIIDKKKLKELLQNRNIKFRLFWTY